jgi:hypothetical protein
MILIGERINGMFKDVKQAIEEKNKQIIQALAQKLFRCKCWNCCCRSGGNYAVAG